MLFKVLKMILAIIILLVIVMMVFFVFKGRASQQGQAPGLQSGALASCPDSPNCVSSETGTPESHSISALNYSDAPEQAWQRVVSAVNATGGRVQADTGEYLAATYHSSLFGFVDDLELRLDSENNKIQVRSASREGYGDMGANKKRTTALQHAFNN